MLILDFPFFSVTIYHKLHRQPKSLKRLAYSYTCRLVYSISHLCHTINHGSKENNQEAKIVFCVCGCFCGYFYFFLDRWLPQVERMTLVPLCEMGFDCAKQRFSDQDTQTHTCINTHTHAHRHKCTLRHTQTQNGDIFQSVVCVIPCCAV